MSPGSPVALPAWAQVGPRRRAHIERVAALADGWAAAMGVPAAERSRWRRAAWLHDALRDAPPAELARLAPDDDLPPELKHGPAAATRAAEHGEADTGVLDAIRYHSVGWPGWDMVGRVLYCADYLEPGRSFDRAERAELARRFPDAPAEVLLAVARRRVHELIQAGWTIPLPTCRFWNALVAAESR